MKSAPNLILIGPMGSGKTSIGRQLAKRLALQFVDVDQEIERSTGVLIPVIFELEGEAGFRAREHAKLEKLCAGEGQVIATGGGAVLHPGTRTLLSERGFVLHLTINLDAQLRRLSRDRRRPLLQQGDRRGVLQRIGDERAPLYAQIADLQHDTSSDNLRRSVEQILTLLREHWQLPKPTKQDVSA